MTYTASLPQTVIRSWCRSTADSWRSTILNMIFFMIRLTLHLWLKLWDPRCLEERQRKSSFFNGSHYSRSLSSRPNIVYIIMHDVNIKEKTRCETLVLTLLLFSSLFMNIWHFRPLKDRGSTWHFSPTKNPLQLIRLRGIAWLVQLKR